MALLEAKDLFGIDRYLSSKKEGIAISERAGLIKYFSDKIERPAQFIGVRMAHYSLDQLYALQSVFKDRFERNGKDAAHKFWWFCTKTNKVCNVNTAGPQ